MLVGSSWCAGDSGGGAGGCGMLLMVMVCGWVWCTIGGAVYWWFFSALVVVWSTGTGAPVLVVVV